LDSSRDRRGATTSLVPSAVKIGGRGLVVVALFVAHALGPLVDQTTTHHILK
jgi:hypothetical protein